MGSEYSAYSLGCRRKAFACQEEVIAFRSNELFSYKESRKVKNAFFMTGRKSGYFSVYTSKIFKLISSTLGPLSTQLKRKRSPHCAQHAYFASHVLMLCKFNFQQFYAELKDFMRNIHELQTFYINSAFLQREFIKPEALLEKFAE